MLGCGARAAEAGGAGGSRSVEGAESGYWAGGVRRRLRVLGAGAGLRAGGERVGDPRRAPEKRAGPRGDLGAEGGFARRRDPGGKRNTCIGKGARAEGTKMWRGVTSGVYQVSEATCGTSGEVS